MGKPMSARLCLWIGLAMIIALTLLFWWTPLDVKIVELGYDANRIPAWTYARRWPWRLGKAVAVWPGLALTVAAGVGWIGSWCTTVLERWRSRCLYVVAVAALGPGLLVHAVLKNLTNRPRPYETVLFGGNEPFLRPFEPNPQMHGASFVSGHASMAFLVTCLFFIVTGWKRWAILAVGLAFGLFVGIGRVLQGDHFPSDVLLPGALDFTLAAGLAVLLQRGKSPDAPSP